MICPLVCVCVCVLSSLRGKYNSLSFHILSIHLQGSHGHGKPRNIGEIVIYRPGKLMEMNKILKRKW